MINKAMIKTRVNMRWLVGMSLVGGVLSACDTGSDTGQIVLDNGNAGVAFTAPVVLLESRTVVRENLMLRVIVGSQVEEVRADVNGEFRLVIELPSNTFTIINLEWFEIIGEQELILATASRPLQVGSSSSPSQINIRENEFDTSRDDDGDGASNLEERQANTDFSVILTAARQPLLCRHR